MRRAWIWVGFAACRFEHGATPEPDAAPPYCDPADTTLVACYQFEGSANDASSNGLNARAANMAFVPGRVGTAMESGATSEANVAESAAFDVTALTIEAWIRPVQLPGAGTRAGIVDNNGQWGFFVYEAGRLQCTTGGLVVPVMNAIVADTWTHVACTYDGATARVYVNGSIGGELSGGGTLSTSGTTGISIAADNPPGAGSPLVGMIDELRLLNVARSPVDICDDAGACP